MKFEIDLNDILSDDCGAETLQDSIKRQVVENITHRVKTNVGPKIETEVATQISVQIKTALEHIQPRLIENILDYEYVPVDTWGNKQREATTFRKELVKHILEKMVYQKQRYDSDKNVFTKAVDATIEAKMSEFKDQFNKFVDSTFVTEAMEYARQKLFIRLGVTNVGPK